jgi:hypothetical protein
MPIIWLNCFYFASLRMNLTVILNGKNKVSFTYQKDNEKKIQNIIKKEVIGARNTAIDAVPILDKLKNCIKQSALPEGITIKYVGYINSSMFFAGTPTEMNLDSLIELAENQEARAKKLLTFAKFKEDFNELCANDKKNHTQEKAVFDDFCNFYALYPSEEKINRKNLVQKWGEDYQKRTSNDPFTILNTQPPKKGFISDDPYSQYLMLFLNFAGNIEDVNELKLPLNKPTLQSTGAQQPVIPDQPLNLDKAQTEGHPTSPPPLPPFRFEKKGGSTTSSQQSGTTTLPEEVNQPLPEDSKPPEPQGEAKQLPPVNTTSPEAGEPQPDVPTSQVEVQIPLSKKPAKKAKLRKDVEQKFGEVQQGFAQRAHDLERKFEHLKPVPEPTQHAIGLYIQLGTEIHDFLKNPTNKVFQSYQKNCEEKIKAARQVVGVKWQKEIDIIERDINDTILIAVQRPAPQQPLNSAEGVQTKGAPHQAQIPPEDTTSSQEPKPDVPTDEVPSPPKATTTPLSEAEEPQPDVPTDEVPPQPEASTTQLPEAEKPKPDVPTDEVPPQPEAATTPLSEAEEPQPDVPTHEVPPQPEATTTPLFEAEEPQPDVPTDEVPSQPEATTTPLSEAEEPQPDASQADVPQQSDEPQPEDTTSPQSAAKISPPPPLPPLKKPVKKAELREEVREKFAQLAQDFSKKGYVVEQELQRRGLTADTAPEGAGVYSLYLELGTEIRNFLKNPTDQAFRSYQKTCEKKIKQAREVVGAEWQKEIDTIAKDINEVIVFNFAKADQLRLFLTNLEDKRKNIDDKVAKEPDYLEVGMQVGQLYDTLNNEIKAFLNNPTDDTALQLCLKNCEEN